MRLRPTNVEQHGPTSPFTWLLAALACTALACTQPGPAPSTEPSPGDGDAPAQTAAEEAQAPEMAAAPAPGCGDGVVKDDGDADTGYGFVPSANWGLYLQSFTSEELGGTQMDRVCLCWLRTRADDEIDFEVVFYAKKQGQPAPEPYATVAASASGVPTSSRDGKGALVLDERFYDVDVSEVTIPEGESYIGVRWNPNADKFFFVCADHSDATEKVNVFQMEDRAPGWQSVLVSSDPMFAKHKAMMLRASAATPEVEAPGVEAPEAQNP
ncbi:MAG: hypothetical protein AAGN66_20280 [Acidobacteriota bacterium]